MEMHELFQTSDYLLSSTLVSLGNPIESIDRNNPQRILFYFKRTENLDEVVALFWKRELVIEPHTLHSAMKFIKTRIRG